MKEMLKWPKEPNYSPEVIRLYRELDRKGGFNRQIKERVPVNVLKDKVVLECGHSTMYTASLLEDAPKMGVKGFRCDECAAEWLKVAGAGGTES
jgi:hypothetical protein